jgi:hypothetical protein
MHPHFAIYIIMGGVGYVTHGGDRFLWALRIPALQPKQVGIVKNWVDRIREEVKELEKEGKPLHDVKMMLALRDDMTIGWKEDQKWDDIMSLHEIIAGGD